MSFFDILWMMKHQSRLFSFVIVYFGLQFLQMTRGLGLDCAFLYVDHLVFAASKQSPCFDTCILQ
jgi:hypothetical protein